MLFTDIRLPGELDGWRLAATAREAKPELPVIYATGYTVDQGAAVPSGVLLKKPYRPSAITRIIRTLIAPPIGWRSVPIIRGLATNASPALLSCSTAPTVL